ncbi:hypothetical protein BJY59DRAFT_584058 [Rhodotorula toruloides]
MSTAASDETVREDVLWSEATADSVTAETRALLDDNPFERPQYSLRPQTHDQLARVRAAANPSSSQKNPGSTPSKPYALPTKDSRRSTEERNWARALLLCSEDWAGCAVNEKNFDAAINSSRTGRRGTATAETTLPHRSSSTSFFRCGAARRSGSRPRSSPGSPTPKPTRWPTKASFAASLTGLSFPIFSPTPPPLSLPSSCPSLKRRFGFTPR